jgi:site-specific DNA recombinase
MRAAIYCRLSDEDRDKNTKKIDSESIKNQEAMLLKHIEDNNWEYVDTYSDDDYTGSDRNRPEWNRLLEDAEKKKFDVILCKTQSRFSREVEMVEKYIHGLFPLWGIRFIGTVDSADTAVEGNKKSRQINGLINEWYLEDMSKSIKAAFDIRRANGLHIGSFPLYGYQKDSNHKGHLIIDKVAADVVREVFRLYAGGMGKTAIARLLNDKGIPNPTEYKRLTGTKYKTPKHKTDTYWKYFSISDMLINEMYIGHMVQGKYGSVSYKTGQNKPRPKDQWYRKENTHEPIIDIELWNRVQEMISLKVKPFSNGEIGLFAKKTKCMNCGYTMRSSKNRGLHYLKCGTRHTAKDACIGSFIGVNTLEKAVLSELRHLLDEYLDKDMASRNIRLSDSIDKQLSKLESEKAVYNKKVAECALALKNLYLDKVKGIINDTEFIEYSRDFTVDKERFTAQVESIDTNIALLEQKRAEAKTKRQIVEQYSKVEKLDRVMVEKLIDFVEVGKSDKVTKQVPIVIHWNF